MNASYFIVKVIQNHVFSKSYDEKIMNFRKNIVSKNHGFLGHMTGLTYRVTTGKRESRGDRHTRSVRFVVVYVDNVSLSVSLYSRSLPLEGGRNRK
jgi:hypothetical protein